MTTQKTRPRNPVTPVFTSLVPLVLLALFSSACSWTVGVRKEENDPSGQSRLVHCTPTAPLVDATTALLTGVVGGLMIGLIDNPDDCPPDARPFCGIGTAFGNAIQTIGGLALIGHSAVYTASALTGWAQYSGCRNEQDLSHNGFASETQSFLPSTKSRSVACETPPPPTRSPSSLFILRW